MKSEYRKIINEKLRFIFKDKGDMNRRFSLFADKLEWYLKKEAIDEEGKPTQELKEFEAAVEKIEELLQFINYNTERELDELQRDTQV